MPTNNHGNNQGVVPILHVEHDGEEDHNNHKSVTISPAATPMEREGENNDSADYFGLTASPPPTSTSTSTAVNHDTERPVLPSRLSAEAFPIYRGSYIKSTSSLKSHWRDESFSNLAGLTQNTAGSNKESSRPGSIMSDPRSMSKVRIERILNKNTEFRDTFDLEELRNGFFDAIFVPPTAIEESYRSAIEEKRLPEQFRDQDRWSVRCKETVWYHVRKVIRHKKGLVLLRAFIGYFICYVLCLVAPFREWVGKYAYFAPWAAVLHHGGRTVGSQLEITAESIVGMAIGMGWSSLALYISTATNPTREGYGGIHACSLIIALWITSWVRAHFIRMYHGLMSCALVLIFMETVDVSDQVYWRKALEFGVPYLVGLAAPLLTCAVVFPDTGHTAIMMHLRQVLVESQNVVLHSTGRDKISRQEARKRLGDLALDFTSAYREMCNEFTFSTLSSKQVMQIKSTLQTAVIRYRSIPKPASLFSRAAPEDPNTSVEIIRKKFATPANELIFGVVEALKESTHYVDYLFKGGNDYDRDKLLQALKRLEDTLDVVYKTYHNTVKIDRIFKHVDHEMLDILLYIHYLYESSKATRELLQVLVKLNSEYKRKWTLSRPIYPFKRGLYRTTSQITHDRGGESAAYYYQAKRDVQASFNATQRVHDQIQPLDPNRSTPRKIEDSQGFRYNVWKVLHKMQGYESRFAIKVSVTLTLVSIPAWIDKSRQWYSENGCWFAAMIACIALHPRVGGNAGDLFTRSAFCFIGALWAGIVNATHNPYAIAVLGVLFMVPCMYRFICTAHPRSGFIGCTAFTLISLSVERDTDIVKATWTRWLALQVGFTCAVLISWIFWPFVARHEVRKSTALILSQISQCYQIVTDRYLYKDEEDKLNSFTLQLGEIREMRMLQSMRALSELIEMTQHEPSLRGEFDSGPYEAMLNSMQYVFQKIADARISSIYFNVYESDASPEVTRQLVSLRRDTTASVICVFYILANAYRSKRSVPRFLPSAAMSRKLLFDSVARLAEEVHRDNGLDNDKDKFENDGRAREERMWRMVHEAAFSRAFTDITEELEKVIAYSKHILGEESISKSR